MTAHISSPAPEHHAQIAGLDRRMSDFEKWRTETTVQLQAISQTLNDSKTFQNRTCDEMKESRAEILRELKTVTQVIHQMQIENAATNAGIVASEKYRSESKTDGKWWVDLTIKLAPYGGMLAVVYYALSKAAGN